MAFNSAHSPPFPRAKPRLGPMLQHHRCLDFADLLSHLVCCCRTYWHFGLFEAYFKLPHRFPMWTMERKETGKANKRPQEQEQECKCRLSIIKYTTGHLNAPHAIPKGEVIRTLTKPKPRIPKPYKPPLLSPSLPCKIAAVKPTARQLSKPWALP